MIIPILCFTCGKPLADKYDFYVEEVKKLQKKEDANTKKPMTKKKEAEQHTMRHFDDLRTGPILDKLGLKRYCCRRHMLTTVDMMDTI
jgi:DNA-directed RNA polymerase subunit N (RpoN/RPB10)